MENKSSSQLSATEGRHDTKRARIDSRNDCTPSDRSAARQPDSSASQEEAVEQVVQSEQPIEKREVINLVEATEQCGGDEEFMRELLDDLKDEVSQSYDAIAQSLEKTPEGWRDTLRRSAHAIKGAAANLMCHELSHAAKTLEARGKIAIAQPNPDDLTALKELASHLQSALDRFVKFLETMI